MAQSKQKTNPTSLDQINLTYTSYEHRNKRNDSINSSINNKSNSHSTKRVMLNPIETMNTGAITNTGYRRTNSNTRPSIYLDRLPNVSDEGFVWCIVTPTGKVRNMVNNHILTFERDELEQASHLVQVLRAKSV